MWNLINNVLMGASVSTENVELHDDLNDTMISPLNSGGRGLSAFLFRLIDNYNNGTKGGVDSFDMMANSDPIADIQSCSFKNGTMGEGASECV
jgi:hypothetical protein